MRAQRGVTLSELLAVTAALGGLLALLLPTVLTVKDAANTAACAANLSRLGQALRLYADDHEGFLPDCGASSPLGGQVPSDGRHFPSLWNKPGTCDWPAVKSLGNQANLWILVRDGYAAARLFVCPATADRLSLNRGGDPAVTGFLAIDPLTGEPAPEEQRFLTRVAAGRCSYSYQNQFAHPGTDPALTGGAPPTTHRLMSPQTLAVLADRNPYTRTDLVRQPVVSPDEYPAANSPNHQGAGQNVLYLEGDVQWRETPCCGPIRGDGRLDNIYRPDEGAPDDPQNIPRSPRDSYLVP